jgi:hypothetical protein
MEQQACSVRWLRQRGRSPCSRAILSKLEMAVVAKQVTLSLETDFEKLQRFQALAASGEVRQCDA